MDCFLANFAAHMLYYTRSLLRAHATACSNLMWYPALSSAQYAMRWTMTCVCSSVGYKLSVSCMSKPLAPSILRLHASQTQCRDPCSCSNLMWYPALSSAQYAMRWTMTCVCNSVGYKLSASCMSKPLAPSILRLRASQTQCRDPCSCSNLMWYPALSSARYAMHWTIRRQQHSYALLACSLAESACAIRCYLLLLSNRRRAEATMGEDARCAGVIRCVTP